MKNLMLLISFCFSFQIAIAQSETEAIKSTLTDYIEGTSYNYTDRINNAFYENAELFLENKEHKLWVVPIKEYVGFFKDSKQGVFNNRIGNIISIDQFENIAIAKVEILMPKRDSRYMDMFLLKKLEGNWKIISKTAAKENSNKKGKRILFVTSNADHYGDSDIKTGNSFSEIVFAYDEFDKAGYIIDFVSPEGGAVPLSYINTADDLQKKYLYNSDFMYGLGHSKSPEEVKTSEYSAIYYVGGGSAMFGVPENKEIQQIAVDIYEKQNGIVASVCHGTAGIVNLKTKDGKYLFANKKVSGYPDEYERAGADYLKEFPFMIQETIEKRGGQFHFAPRGSSHVEVDGRLITGQNNLSAKGMAEAVIETLSEIEKEVLQSQK
ncbi:MAG: nuclear transport factor 2 family protein [Saprospiraceae bacterium]